MTNDIGTGTKNIVINVPVDEQMLLGKLSVKFQAKSVGDSMRRLTLLGLQTIDSEAAKELASIREQYYGKPPSTKEKT